MQPGVGGGGGGGHVVGAPGGTGDDEAPKDPGARITHQSYTEKDYEGKTNCAFFPPLKKFEKFDKSTFFLNFEKF